MFGDLIKGIKSSAFGVPETPVVDAKKFRDPVALGCGWQPMKSGSANFTTHKLHKSTESNLVFKPTPIMLAMGILFVLAGLGLLASFLLQIFGHWVVLVVGLVFTIAGSVVFLQSTSPIVFNNQRKSFCKGRNKKICANFDLVHGIQLLTKIGKVSSSSENFQQDRYFYAYEMNLVLHDSNRIHVMTYANKDMALHDAGLVANLLNCPLWNGTNEGT